MHTLLQWLHRLLDRGSSDRRARGRRADDTGRRGERVAARALRRRGYTIVARRWRTPAGEIDLLATIRGVVAIVEVKASRARSRAPLAARIDRTKRRRLLAAKRYVGALPAFRGQRVRIDLVFVTWHDDGVDVDVRADVFRRRR